MTSWLPPDILTYKSVDQLTVVIVSDYITRFIVLKYFEAGKS